MNEISFPVAAAGHRPADHPQVSCGAIGVLIVNLGTPDATDARSVRHYLREFLHDKRVIEEDTITWKFVLNAIILPLRPGRKGLDYQKIWNTEKNESPLKTITRSQADKLTTALAQYGDRVVVDWAMRYGNPSMRSRRILVVPLYPQYAAATSATVCDEAFRALMKMRWQPTLRVAPP
jgi:protoporphyrin/coproporphyrin ferrochelatase